MDLLPAPTVTKANVDDPTLWANGGEELSRSSCLLAVR